MAKSRIKRILLFGIAKLELVETLHSFPTKLHFKLIIASKIIIFYIMC